jgi:hypothetical protein
LFLRNASGIWGATSTELFLERCTVAWNAQTIRFIIVKDSAFFGNANPENVGNYSHCSFYGPTGACPPGPNNICGQDPLFVDAGDPFDPDNNPGHDVFYLKAGSPLLNGGEHGGVIGAFGQGFHTSKDVTKDEPPQEEPPASSPWRDWIDQNGDALGASGLVEFNESNEVLLKEGVTSAALYSPVFDTGSAFTVIRSVDFAGFEDTAPLPGSREIIDAVQSTPRREIRIRTHTAAEGTFSQDPGITPPSFGSVDKRVKLRKRAQFVQMELVLRKDGD